MKRLPSLVAALSLFSFTTTAQSPPPNASGDTYAFIRCGTLLAVPGKPPETNKTIVTKNGVILEILNGLDAQSPGVTEARRNGAIVWEADLSTKFVLPGLIDCHVHLTSYYDQTQRLRAVQETPEFVTAKATHYARLNLEAGFTTVRDLGASNPQTIFAVRDAINQGLIQGPRIIAAGKSISMTGGHADNTLGYRQDLFGIPSPDDGIADGPDECTKAVRNQIKLGADVIKTTATGGVLSASSAGLAQHYFDDELAAIVKASHSLGKKVAAHAHGVDGINAALAAGVDSIEHGTYLDDKSIDLFKNKNAYYVPTMLAAATVGANAEKPGYYLPMVADKARLVGPRLKESVKKAHAAGVQIAFGTDTGVSEHGQNAREFALLVNDAGLTPMDAIASATVVASRLLGLDKEIGTLEVGKQADLIAVQDDPLKDVTTLERPHYVMKGGVEIKGPPKRVW